MLTIFRLIKLTNKIYRLYLSNLPIKLSINITQLLRKILYIYLPGYSPIALRINNINHEYTYINGCNDDYINLILNLKTINFKLIKCTELLLNITIKNINIFKSNKLVIPGFIYSFNNIIITSFKPNTIFTFSLIIKKGNGLFNELDDTKSIFIDDTYIKLSGNYNPINKLYLSYRNKLSITRSIITIKTNGTINYKTIYNTIYNIFINKLTFNKSLLGKLTNIYCPCMLDILLNLNLNLLFNKLIITSIIFKKTIILLRDILTIYHKYIYIKYTYNIYIYRSIKSILIYHNIII